MMFKSFLFKMELTKVFFRILYSNLALSVVHPPVLLVIPNVTPTWKGKKEEFDQI